MRYSELLDGKIGYEEFLSSCDHARSVSLLGAVDGLLQWDEQTMLPSAAGDFRAEQVAALAAVTHAQRTEKEQGDRLQRLKDSLLGKEGPRVVQATIQLLHEDFQKQSRVPGKLVQELARTSIEAQQAWVRAVKASEWKPMVSHLEKMFSLKRELAACQRPDLDPYDALLDDYEPGARWKSINATFSCLRKALAPLVRGCIESSEGPQETVLRGNFPLQSQQAFVRLVVEKIGFSFERGRLDTTAHPFCSTLGPNDCRLTTRWDEKFLPTALYSVLHEAGHGLYEQGLPVDWFGLPPGEAASLGIHESQSRLWENLVGRSPEFWEWCHPIARNAFPEPFNDVSPGTLAKAVRSVSPNFIRVEADEVTYNLHVMMRFDLEREIIHGNLLVADLPSAWNERFEADFGRRPSRIEDGVLQDIHWPAGLIGYFPTYTLGNIFSAQIMAAAQQSGVGTPQQIRDGEFAPLLHWLRENVHAFGRTYTSEALVEKASGKPVSEQYLVDSLYQRYGPLHGLSPDTPQLV